MRNSTYRFHLKSCEVFFAHFTEGQPRYAIFLCFPTAERLVLNSFNVRYFGGPTGKFREKLNESLKKFTKTIRGNGRITVEPLIFNEALLGTWLYLCRLRNFSLDN